ncbi:ATP-binding protein [Phaeospirillum tilakii]|uniref:ATP-binding protein n=1 Tax=Phaeospirillum tilakii TaxID=741673 RepID=A0ABW5CI49_9PROT
MRENAQYLVDISQPSKEFDAIQFIQQCLLSDIDQLRYASIYSRFHAHVKRHGYPIPAEDMAQSFYTKRKKLEEEVNVAILSLKNLYIVGCEGSGKTTLLHYVISTNYERYKAVFCYIDASDMGPTTEATAEAFYTRFRDSLFLSLPPELKNEFKEWIKKFADDPFTENLVSTSTTKQFVESILIFMNNTDGASGFYLIIDNLDSLKSETVKEFFLLLRRLEETVASAFHTLCIKDCDKVRIITCCRTQSIDIVTSASQGIFTTSPFATIDMDERFTADTDIIELTRKFLDSEKNYFFGKSINEKKYFFTGANFGGVGWDSFDDYSNAVFDWLSKSREEVNSTIVKFCGRSIRRSKLFLVKALASPIIARLVFFERHNVYNITRTDKDYLKRRMREAIFDFSTASTLQLPGYPLNPFAVLRDEHNFKNNPLIGIVSLLYIHENIDILRMKDVHYAQAISIKPLCDYLLKMKYEYKAVSECISSFVLSGLIRPIIGSAPLNEGSGEGDGFIIYDQYIIDHYALRAYTDLILFAKWQQSLTFYNMALRFRYKIRGDHHLDNMAYEAYTFLVFILDLLERERALEIQIRGTGIMFRPLSARIRYTIFSVLPSEIKKAEETRRSRNIPENIRQDQAELLIRTRNLLDEVRWNLSKQAGII